MKILLLLLSISSMLQAQMVFNFSKEVDARAWQVVDDGVMGGLSAGHFEVNNEGHGVFKGTVSLENNGGFSSIRYPFKGIEIEGAKKIVIRAKGDGKRYQFRVKHDSYSYYSYIAYFTTSGEWENIEISLADMYPSFRGRKLNQPNFDHSTIREVGILIANKKAESFELQLDKIMLQ